MSKIRPLVARGRDVSIVNNALRDHVTRVGFDLTLGKTHIAALVVIDKMLEVNDRVAEPRGGAYRHTFAMFVSGMRGLQDRGLITHEPPVSRDRRDHEPRKIWTITTAGRLVIDLLKEAGIYQEYLAALPVQDAAP